MSGELLIGFGAGVLAMGVANLCDRLRKPRDPNIIEALTALAIIAIMLTLAHGVLVLVK